MSGEQEKHLIDANVFLEAKLEQRKSSQSREYLEKVASGDFDAFLTIYHLDAILYRMETGGASRQQLKKFIESLRDYLGLEVRNLGLESRIEAFETFLSFDDGLIVAAAQNLECDVVVSYDTDFDGVEGVKRKEPGEFV